MVIIVILKQHYNIYIYVHVFKMSSLLVSYCSTGHFSYKIVLMYLPSFPSLVLWYQLQHELSNYLHQSTRSSPFLSCQEKLWVFFRVQDKWELRKHWYHLEGWRERKQDERWRKMDGFLTSKRYYTYIVLHSCKYDFFHITMAT